MFLLLMRAARALEGGPSGVRTFSGSVLRTPSGVEGLPKVCCRGRPRFGHLCSQCSSVCGSSLHSGHVGSAAGSGGWAYALRSGVWPARRRARRSANRSFRTPWLFGACWTVTVCQMRAFAVANEMGRGGVLVAVAAAFANLSAASLPGMLLWPGTQIRVVEPSLLSSRWRIDWVSCAPL